MSTNSKIRALYNSSIKENSSMKYYAKYLENEKFVSWVYNPTDETEKYWNSYIRMNPLEKETILFLRDSLLALRPEERTLSDLEKKVLLTKVEKEIKSRQKGPYLKYAAVILILLSLGASLFNLQETKNSLPNFNALKTVSIDTLSNTQLILGSGRQVAVANEKSSIKYSNNGEVIINSADTLRGVKKTLDIETLNQLIVPYGKKSQIVLSDGSIVHLNSGSKLIFPEKFLNNRRKVYLDGEAFFEVESDTKRPFFVQSLNSETEIMAVGTKFNVTAYSSDQHIRTVLVEGKVNLVESKNPQNKKATMNPNQLAEWSEKQNEVVVIPVDVYPYIAWMDGILQFESESLSNISKKLERFYNIKIEFPNSFDAQNRISGKLDLNEEIKKTLSNIAATTNITYETMDNNIYILKKK